MTQRAAGVRLVALVLGVLAVLWSLQNGLFTMATEWAGKVVAERLTTSIQGAGTSVAGVGETPDRLSCDDVDVTSFTALRGVDLVARPEQLGCTWLTTDEAGHPVVVLRLAELTGAVEATAPTTVTSRETGRAVVRPTPPAGSQVTVLRVAAGAALSSAKNAPDATRSMSVTVDGAKLGLTAKQARRVATAIATAASSRHEPLPTADQAAAR